MILSVFFILKLQKYSISTLINYTKMAIPYCKHFNINQWKVNLTFLLSSHKHFAVQIYYNNSLQCPNINIITKHPQMKLDNTISYFDNPNKIQTVIRQAKRNGYFQQIKQLNRFTVGIPNTFDISYKKNVHTYYKKKITKPFSLFQQPQYKRQLRFNSDFSAFVKSIPQFQKIKEEPIYEMPEMDGLQKEVHSQTLIYDAAKKCEVSPENLAKRRLNTVQVNKPYMENQGIFTTKINLTQNLLSTKQKYDNESRIGIHLDTGKRSYSKSSYDSPLSPQKKLQKLRNLTKAKQKQRSHTINLKLLKSRRSNMSIHQSKQKQSISSTQKFFINETIALQTLNRIAGSDHKAKNFRISKQKIHQLLLKRYGNQIITQFFTLQANEDMPGVLKLFRLILTSSPKLLQMLTFLTLDINRDGIITEDQLNYLNNYINVQCALTEDINKVIQYAKDNPNLKCQHDLPMDFIKMPTYKEYLKINQEHKDIEVGSVRGIYRLFSFKADKQDKQFGSSLPVIGSKNIDLNKKKIRINFQTFQKIYDKSKHPYFIEDLAIYVLGKNYNKQQEDNLSPRKTNISNKKKQTRTRKQTFIFDSNLREKLLSYNSINSHHSEQSSQLSRAQEILGKMQKDNKNLMTMQYD